MLFHSAIGLQWDMNLLCLIFSTINVNNANAFPVIVQGSLASLTSGALRGFTAKLPAHP
jgi:hypothetical protein